MLNYYRSIDYCMDFAAHDRFKLISIALGIKVCDIFPLPQRKELFYRARTYYTALRNEFCHQLESSDNVGIYG